MATFDENGNYIKTDWKDGDKITALRLNKMEAGIASACNDTAKYNNNIVLSSPNGTLFKIAVDDNGNLTASQI